MILVLGGARSGKSGYAEQLACQHGERILYLATAQITDGEMAERVAKHRLHRPSSWTTHEGFLDLANVIRTQAPGHDAVLLECVTTLLTNLLFDRSWHPSAPGSQNNASSIIGGQSLPSDLSNDDTGSASEIVNEPDVEALEPAITAEIDRLMAACEQSSVPVYLVSNEIGFGLVPETRLSRQFRDLAGRINQRLAARAEQVYVVFAGLPLQLKGATGVNHAMIQTGSN